MGPVRASVIQKKRKKKKKKERKKEKKKKKKKERNQERKKEGNKNKRRQDTRLPKLHAGGQGPYLRSLDHLGRSGEVQT